MDWTNLLFSYQGRINRAKFWLAVLVFFVAAIVAAIVGAASGSEALGQLLTGIVNLVCFVSGIFIAIKRLHDRDKSGWWLLLFYIAPSVLLAIGTVWAIAAIVGDSSGSTGFLIALAGFAVGIWGFVELGCLRGTVGPNQYGPDPLIPQLPGGTMAPPPPYPTAAPPPPPPTMAPPPPPPRTQ